MAKNKIILQLISSGGFFGAENVMVQLSKELLSSEYKPIIGIIGNYKNSHLEVVKEAKKNDLEVELFYCNGTFNLMTILKIRQYIKDNHIDIIHSHGYKSNFYGLLASLFIPLRRITTCHNWLGNSVKMKFYEHLDKLLLNRFDKIIGVSDTLRNEILRSGIPKYKVTVINNGVNVSRFQDTGARLEVKKKLGIKENEKVVGTIGRLTEEKGHIYLLKAFKSVIKEFPNTKLLIVGDGPLRNTLQSMVNSLQLNDKVIFTGIRNDIPEMLNILEIFVLPSLDEEMPMALLEAMAAKKPIVATKVGAIPKVIEDGYSGILVEAKNINSTADSIVRLLKNKEKRSFIAQSASVVVMNRFSAKNMAKNYILVYDSFYCNHKSYKKRIPILMYHEIAGRNRIRELSRVIQERYIIEQTIFDKQLQYLHQNGYKCITISELLRYENFDKTKVACITFDDGYIGNYLYAFPLLKKYRYKATFFVVTNWIGKNNMMFWSQLKEMLDEGMEIGSHTKNHLVLVSCDTKTIAKELEESKRDIKKHLGYDVKVVSYPSGSYTNRINKIAKNIGYQTMLSSDFGYWQPQNESFIIKRLTVTNEIDSLIRILDNDKAFIFVSTLKEVIKKILKFILGRTRYERLYFKIFNLQLPIES